MYRAWGPLSRRLPPGGGEADFVWNLIMATCPIPHFCSTRLPPSTPFDSLARSPWHEGCMWRALTGWRRLVTTDWQGCQGVEWRRVARVQLKGKR
jgi:hypothetical protein